MSSYNRLLKLADRFI